MLYIGRFVRRIQHTRVWRLRYNPYEYKSLITLLFEPHNNDLINKYRKVFFPNSTPSNCSLYWNQPHNAAYLFTIFFIILYKCIDTTWRNVVLHYYLLNIITYKYYRNKYNIIFYLPVFVYDDEFVPTQTTCYMYYAYIIIAIQYSNDLLYNTIYLYIYIYVNRPTEFVLTINI